MFVRLNMLMFLRIGPEAVGMDFAFIGSRHVYGIPEHASSLALKNTKYDLLSSSSILLTSIVGEVMLTVILTVYTIWMV